MKITDLARRHAAMYLSRGQLPVSDDDPIVRAFQKCIDEASDERDENKQQRDLLLDVIKELEKTSRFYYNSYSLKINSDDESGTIEGVIHALSLDLKASLQKADKLIAECEEGE